MRRFRLPFKALFPILALTEEVASIAPLLALIASGLDADNTVGSPFIPAMLAIALLAYAMVRRMTGAGSSERTMRGGLLILGLAIAIAAPWVSGLGPAWNASVLGISLFATFQAFLGWWRGIYYASRSDSFSADEAIGIVQRSWIVLAGSLVLIPILDGIDSDAAIDTAGIALPVAAIAALLLLALAQMQRASKRSKEVGGTTPDRRRWLTFTAIFAVIVVGIAMGVSAAIGDDTARAILTPFEWVWTSITFVLTYAFFAIAVVVLVLFYPIIWLIQQIKPRTPQQQNEPQGMGNRIDRLQNGSNGDGFPHWLQLTAEIVAVVVVIAIVALIIARTLKKQGSVEDDEDLVEEHESLWSRDLMMNQLKGLFRRGGDHASTEQIDFRRTPASVREAYRALLALAQRDGIPRRDDETPAEFAARLRRVWPTLAGDISGLTREYELARYGELTESSAVERARSNWAAIWAVRDTPGST